MNTLRIATRNSPLALCQSEFIQSRLQSLLPDADISLLSMTTLGDKLLSTSLSKIGGKGLFVKELQRALLSDEADLAVHSMKDVPAEFPEGLDLVAICERAAHEDVLVSEQYKTLADMPEGCVIGTSSLRRKAQLSYRYPQLRFRDLRGNVNTRLKKLADGEFDGIILAAAGLNRLKLSHHIASLLPITECLPAAGQGALGLEAKTQHPNLLALLKQLACPNTTDCVTAERAVTRVLGGSCTVPIAAYAHLDGDTLCIKANIGMPDGSRLLEAERRGSRSDASKLGTAVANDLIALGANDILSALHDVE